MGNTGRKIEGYRLGTVSGSYTTGELKPVLGVPNLTLNPNMFLYDNTA
jgi:hypothetical protein